MTINLADFQPQACAPVLPGSVAYYDVVAAPEHDSAAILQAAADELEGTGWRPAGLLESTFPHEPRPRIVVTVQGSVSTSHRIVIIYDPPAAESTVPVEPPALRAEAEPAPEPDAADQPASAQESDEPKTKRSKRPGSGEPIA